MHEGYMTQRQKDLIRDSGLVPAEWTVRHENAQYLYLSDIAGEHMTAIMDKASRTLVKKCPGLPAVAAGQ